MVVEEELVTFKRGCGQTKAFKYLKYKKNEKKKGKRKCTHRWNPERQLGFPATEKPCCLPQEIITCQVTKLNIHFTIYPETQSRPKKILKEVHPRCILKFSNTCNGFNMIPNFYYNQICLLINVPNAN